MSDKARIEGRVIVRRAEVACEACEPGGTILWRYTGDHAGEKARQAARAHAAHRGLGHAPVVVVTISVRYEVVS